MVNWVTRRTFTTVGAAGAVAGLAACSGGSGGALGDDGGGDGTSLVVPVNESPWLDAYKGLVERFQEETGVSVELRVFPYDEMRTQVINDIQSGSSVYDIYQIDEPNLHEFFINEWVVPFTDIDPSFEQDPAINDYADFTRWDAESNLDVSSGW